MSGAVQVRGLAELQRDFKLISRDLRLELQRELRAAGEIVAADARPRLAEESPKSAAGLKPRTRIGLVAVQQTLRRTTGLRPDWGRWQMVHALEPALDAKTEEVVASFDGMLDRLGAKYGF